MDSISRRYFLQMTAALTALGWSRALFSKSSTSELWLLSPASWDGKEVVAFNNLTRGTSGTMPGVPQGHSVLVHPGKNGTVLALPKYGTEAIELDVRAGKVTGRLSSIDGYQFYGHGLFSPDGKVLYTSESAEKADEGLLAVRDGGTYRILSRLPTHGTNPHDCHFVDGGRTLVVANAGPKEYDTTVDGGKRTSLAFLEVGTGKLLKKMQCPTPNIKLAHFLPLDDKTMVVGGVPGIDKPKHPGRVVLSNASGELEVLAVPEAELAQIRDEVLSLAVDPKRSTVAVTFPMSGHVAFWNFKTRAFLALVPLKEAKGIVFDSGTRRFLVSNGGKPRLLAIDADTLKPSSKQNEVFLGGNGSHMTALELV